MGKACGFASATTGNSTDSLSVQDPSSTENDTLKIAAVVQQIIIELSEAVSEKEKNNGHYKCGT
jgi:hypothetical protein